ncbi:hypothetical protein ACHAW6_000558, partial [Cyclotella cf. meneghiniana]
MNPKKNNSEDKSNAGDECCIRFEPSEFYDNKETDFKIIHWENKPFVKDGAHCWQVTRSLSMSTWSFYDSWPCDDDFTGAAANISCFYNQHYSLYVPIRFDKAVIRAFEKIDNCPGAALPKEEVMIMSDCASPWYTNVLVSVATQEVNGAAVEKISGDFLAKVFEGDYSNIGKWVKEVEKLVPSVRDSMELDGTRNDKNQVS